MHPNEPQLFWQAAMTARAPASRTDLEGIQGAIAAIDDLAGFAAHASPPVAKRAHDLLVHFEGTAADTWVQVMAGHAWREAKDCRAALPSP
jgi:hypothetical protein